VVIAVTILSNHYIFSVYLFNVSTHVFICVVVYYLPFESLFVQIQVIVDELTLWARVYHMFLFTDFVNDPSWYPLVGTSVMCVIITNIAISFAVFVVENG
jgi:hypothetical protein